MAKINIMGVRSGSKAFTVHIVLSEDSPDENPDNVIVLGEAFLEIPEGTEMPDIKTRIVDAATEIMKKHKDSVDKRHDIEELDFPPIE